MTARAITSATLWLAIASLAAIGCSRSDDDVSSRVSSTPARGPAADGARPEDARSIAGYGGRGATAKLDMAEAPQSAPAPPAPRSQGAGSSVSAVSAAVDSGIGPMLIRTGDARVEVDSLERAMAAVRALAARTGAVIGSTTQQGGREAVRSATLELRVPAARFDLLVNGLSPLGHVEHVNVHAQDVGEEFVDITARVANARRLEERLVQLLASRTGRLEDVLAVERELARVREEIERYEGRLRFLRTRVAVSTLSVTVHEKAPLVASHPGANPMREALVEAWRRFVGTTAGVIVMLGALLPVAIIGGAAWLAARRARRRWFGLLPRQDAAA